VFDLGHFLHNETVLLGQLENVLLVHSLSCSFFNDKKGRKVRIRRMLCIVNNNNMMYLVKGLQHYDYV
jgi:hypothetical protein